MHQLILCIWYFAIATKTKISCVACLTVLRSSSVGSEFFLFLSTECAFALSKSFSMVLWFKNGEMYDDDLPETRTTISLSPSIFIKYSLNPEWKHLCFPINEFGLNKSQTNSMLESRSSMCNFTDNYNLFNINHSLIFLHLLEICCEIFITKTRREIINTFMIFDADLIES